MSHRRLYSALYNGLFYMLLLGRVCYARHVRHLFEYAFEEGRPRSQPPPTCYVNGSDEIYQHVPNMENANSLWKYDF